jgi:hypothetical protein
MKNFLKKITGLDKVEAKAREEAERAVQIAEEAKHLAEEATAAAVRAQEAEELSKMTPKQRATKRKEPWVAVLETHVNKENPSNGFFEIDWNEYFVLQLREAGFGFDGDTDETVVDLWFKTIVRNMLSEEGLDMANRSQGFINVQKLDATRSEIG